MPIHALDETAVNVDITEWLRLPDCNELHLSHAEAYLEEIKICNINDYISVFKH